MNDVLDVSNVISSFKAVSTNAQQMIPTNPISAIATGVSNLGTSGFNVWNNHIMAKVAIPLAGMNLAGAGVAAAGNIVGTILHDWHERKMQVINNKHQERLQKEQNRHNEAVLKEQHRHEEYIINEQRKVLEKILEVSLAAYNKKAELLKIAYEKAKQRRSRRTRNLHHPGAPHSRTRSSGSVLRKRKAG